eukprot:Tbor_TRINITY_DN2928_c0_g1::TRINITY_DN2928_c0_g1_i1::g.1100::m.1100/K00326/E1.6.2.2; cytochrome-b5 reductase
MSFLRAAFFGGSLAFGAASKSYNLTSNVYADTNTKDKKKEPVFDHNFRKFTLGEVINLADDVAILRFLTNSPDDEFSLVPCSTLQACTKTGSMLVDELKRFYTPVTKNGAKGYFDILVKKQPNGRMTEHLFGMEVGEKLLFRAVQYKLSYQPNKWKEIGMIAGGTGIAPVYQVIQHSCNIPDDKTKLSLLFANQTESKILLKGCLDEYSKQTNGRFSVNYVLDRPDEDWKGYKGFIDAKMVKETMPPPGKDMKVLVCGPDNMMTHVVGAPVGVLKAMSGGVSQQPTGANLNNFNDVRGILGNLGYEMDMVYRF